MRHYFSHAAICFLCTFPGFGFAEKTAVTTTGFSLLYFLKLGLALLLVLGIFIAFAWVMRRMNGLQGSSGSHLKVISALSLGTRERLIIVKAGKSHLLLGVTPGQISKLHELEEDLPLELPSENLFAEKLKSALQKRSNT